jgi:hypothetical protein
MRHYLYLVVALLWSSPMSAKEPLVLYLERGESVAHLAVEESTLAIGVSYLGAYERGKSVAEQAQCLIVLIRDGFPPTRIPLKPGAMRSLVGMPMGFVAGRVVYDHEGRMITHIFEVDLKGNVTEMPPLPIDLVGIWANEAGEVFAYDTGGVFRWSTAKPVWEKLPLDPGVNAEAIRKIVTLKDGSSLVVTDRLLRGFKSLQKPPIFVDDLKTYPETVWAYGEDQWWIVTTSDDAQKLSRIAPDGQVREVASLGRVGVTDVLFSGKQLFVVCSGRWDNAHNAFYFTLDRDRAGSLRGPFGLPNDTMSACIWKDAIVTGNIATSRVFETVLAPIK